MPEQNLIPTNLTPFSLPHQSVSPLSLSLSSILSLLVGIFFLFAPFSVRRRVHSSTSLTQGKRTFQRLQSKPISGTLWFSPKVYSSRSKPMWNFVHWGWVCYPTVCVSNFGIGVGFGFNRVDRFVNFIWVSCFFFFFFFSFFFFFGLILIGISSTSS